MAGPYIQCEGFLLRKVRTSEAMEQLSFFTAGKGLLLAYRRLRKKPGPTAEPDLFDRIEVVLEGGNSTWFIREAHINRRFSGIGNRYSCLVYASRFASALLNNPLHEGHATGHFRNLEPSLAAWERGKRPEVVYFKSLYLFAREEGLPVKEEWWPRLSEPERNRVAELLKHPIDQQVISAEGTENLAKKLEEYLQHHADVRF
ncbi:MAG: hypothetical protein WD490_11210 [Opitutales bacterium]